METDDTPKARCSCGFLHRIAILGTPTVNGTRSVEAEYRQEQCQELLRKQKVTIDELSWAVAMKTRQLEEAQTKGTKGSPTAATSEMLEELQGRLRAKNEETEALLRQTAAAQSARELQQMDIDALRRQVRDLQAQQGHTGDTAQRGAEALETGLQAKNAELEAAVRQAAVQQSAAEQQIVLLKSQLVALRPQSNVTKDDEKELDQLRQRIQALESFNGQLVSRNAELQATCSAMEETRGSRLTAEAYENQLTEVKLQLEQKHNMIEELRQQHRQQVSDLIAQLEQCHLRIEDLGQEKAQLTAELATQSPTGSKPSPGRHSPEGSPLQPKGKQQAVVDDEMLADFEDVKQQLEDEIQVKDEELDQLAQEFEMIKKDAQQMEEELKASRLDTQSLREQLQDKRALLDQAQEELRVLRATAAAPHTGTVAGAEAEEAAHYAQALRAAQSDLQAARAEAVRVQADEAARAELMAQDYRSLKEQLEEQLTENIRLKGVAEELVQVRAQLADAKQQLQLRDAQPPVAPAAADSEAQQTTQQLAALTRQNKAMAAELTAVRQELDEKRADFTRLSETHLLCEQQIMLLKAECSLGMGKALDRRSPEAEGLGEKMAIHAHLHRREMERKNSELDRVRDELRQLTWRYAAQSEEVERLRGLNGQLTQRNENFQSIKAKLKEQFELHTQEHKSITEQLERTLQKNKRLKREVQELRGALAEAQATSG